jgi:hypothetical protein
MALNLGVLFVPQEAEPIAKGNCVAVMRGGEEAGGKTEVDEQKSDISLPLRKQGASVVRQPGTGRGHPTLLLIIARVDPWAFSPRA